MASAAMGVAAMVGGCASSAGDEQASLTRPDCPGQIICPITGDLVCIDRCPAGAGNAASREVALAVAQPPACCAGKN